MKIWLKRTLSGLAPADNESERVLKKYKIGDTVRADIIKPRNVMHHRKYWALLNMVFDNLPEHLEPHIKNVDELHYEIKLQTGHREIHNTLGGQEIWKAKSISFSSMDQNEFEDYYNSALDVVCKYILPGVDISELTNEVTQTIL